MYGILNKYDIITESIVKTVGYNCCCMDVLYSW